MKSYLHIIAHSITLYVYMQSHALRVHIFHNRHQGLRSWYSKCQSNKKNIAKCSEHKTEKKEQNLVRKLHPKCGYKWVEASKEPLLFWTFLSTLSTFPSCGGRGPVSKVPRPRWPPSTMAKPRPKGSSEQRRSWQMGGMVMDSWGWKLRHLNLHLWLEIFGGDGSHHDHDDDDDGNDADAEEHREEQNEDAEEYEANDWWWWWMIQVCPIHFHIHPAFSEAVRQDKIWPVEGKSAPPRILCGTGGTKKLAMDWEQVWRLDIHL